MIKKQLLACLFLLWFKQTLAQNENELKEYTLIENRSKIESANANRMVQTISAEDIRNSSAKTLTELLENTAGIDIRSRGAFGTQADIQIRGGSFEQTLVLINGVKFTDPQTGHHMLNLPLCLLDIERIEILKGAAARVYGQNAYAGVVNIISKQATGKSLAASLVQGAYNLQQQTLSGNFQVKNYRQRLSLQRTSSDGYRSNTDFSTYQGFYESGYTKQNSSLRFMAGFQGRNMGANGFYTDRYPWQYEETRMGFGNIQWEQKNWLNLRFRSNYRQHRDVFELKRDTPSFSENRHRSEVMNTDISIGENNRLGKWNLGIEYRKEWLNSSNLGIRNRNILGVFAEQQINLGTYWNLVPGINCSNYSDYGWAAYPGIDVGYHRKAFHVSAHAGKTFRVPTYTELYYTDGAKSSLGNPNLKPEQAYSYEVNARYQRTALSIQGALFFRDGLQQIDWVKDSLNDPSWKAGNLGAIQTKGYELTANIFPSRYFHRSRLQSIQLGYCQIWVNQSTEKNITRYVYDYLAQQVTFTLNSKIAGPIFANVRYRFENRYGYQSYSLLDAKLSCNLKRLSIFAEASNVLDQTYVETGKVQMPGRWFRAGITAQIIGK